MKYFLLFFLIVQLYAIENLELNRVIDQNSIKLSNVLHYENRLFIEGEGCVEEYQLMEESAPVLISRIDKPGTSQYEATIYGDTLYVIDGDYGSFPCFLKIIDISAPGMQLSV